MSNLLLNVIPILLNVLAGLLESLFTSSHSSQQRAFGSGSNGSDGSSDGDTEHRDTSQMNEDEKASALRSARAFFGLTESEATDRDKVRKSYKKMSLQHHPDRNGNSAEAVEMMAKVNHHYDVLENAIDELERKASGGPEDDEHEPPLESEDEAENMHSNGTQTQSPSSQKKKNKAQRKRERRKRNQARRAAEEAAQARRNAERAEMEREMRRQWEEISRRRQKVKADAKRMRKKSRQTMRCEKLDRDEGREKAHDRWQEAVREAEARDEEAAAKAAAAARDEEEKARQDASQEMGSTGQASSLHDIDDDSDPPPPTKSSSDEVKEKKKKAPAKAKKSKKAKAARNPIMEACTDDIAIYLRLGQADLAIDEIQEQIGEELAKLVFQNRRFPDERDVAEAMRVYLRRRVDQDDNGVLHYAVYFGSSEVIDFIYSLSRRSDSFLEVFLMKNDFGLIPLDYVKGRSSVIDETTRSKIDSLTEMAKREYQDTLFLPMMKKSIARFVTIIRRINWGQVASTLACYIVGTQIFHRGAIVSVLITAWAQITPKDVDYDDVSAGEKLAADVFVYHITWSLLRTVTSFLWNASDAFVPLLALSLPFSIMCCCSQGGPDAGSLVELFILPFNGMFCLQSIAVATFVCIVQICNGILCVFLPGMTKYLRLFEKCYSVGILSILAVGVLQLYQFLSAF